MKTLYQGQLNFVLPRFSIHCCKNYIFCCNLFYTRIYIYIYISISIYISLSQELCESRGGCPGLPPHKPMVSVHIKQHFNMNNNTHTHTHTYLYIYIYTDHPVKAAMCDSLSKHGEGLFFVLLKSLVQNWQVTQCGMG